MDLQGKREELSRPKGKRESGPGHEVLSSFPPYYQAARTHDRTETEIDFPVGLTPQPSIFACSGLERLGKFGETAGSSAQAWVWRKAPDVFIEPGHYGHILIVGIY